MMPRLDGLALVAALRTNTRTVGVPVLLLSARAGQEASSEGLRAGADDYLVKPFAAADLLARVRANIELARLRTHHTRWRAALVESLQEAFFVCDEVGAVIEINNAFTDILGFGPEDLPYAPEHPWWPDAETQPEAHQQIVDAFAGIPAHPHGSYTIPVNHRDGHRVWITANIAHAEDPDTGRGVMVGTFRDVTAEHYSGQRQSRPCRTESATCTGRYRRRRVARRDRTTARSMVGPPRVGRDLPGIGHPGTPRRRRRSSSGPRCLRQSGTGSPRWAAAGTC